MSQKTLNALGIIGLLTGLASAIYGIYNFVLDVMAVRSITWVNEEIFPNFQLYATVGLVWSFISILIALAVGIVSLICILKINKKPCKKDYKALIIANAIGLITPFSIGSIFLLIYGIAGIKRLKHN